MNANNNKNLRFLICPCGNTEDLPIDEQRHHSQHFDWIENADEEAIYRCMVCGQTVHSCVKRDPIRAVASFAASFTGDEPMDGDQTEHLSKVFLYFLNRENGNLSKAEDLRIRRSLNITD